MVSFKKPDLDSFQERIHIATLFVTFCFLLLVTRLVWLQLVSHGKYALLAESNRIALVPAPANRGLLIDRNGIVIGRNYSALTLDVNAEEVKGNVDQLINELSEIIDISPRDRRNFKRSLEDSRNMGTFPLRSMLNEAETARFMANRYRFPGVEIRARSFREYPYNELASHLIGYIGRVSQKDKERMQAEIEGAKGNDPDALQASFLPGIQYVGKIGLEQSYESVLRGVPGYDQVEITAGGKPVRTLSSSPSVPGKNVVLSVDIKLQYLVEQLYGNFRGAFVAIEPETGDILAFVSKPNFNPNDFVEGIDSVTWKELNESPQKPLYNRPLKGIYPPGSTYKPFMALAALELQKRTPSQTISDPGYFEFGNHTFRDDKKGGHGIVDMQKSIVDSCDTYYYLLARDMGVNMMHDFMKPFGFGQITGIDLQGESRGVLPSTEWKKNTFKKPEQQKWYEGETISLGIGQGYNAFTILQLAHGMANLANNGIVMKPHLVKAIEDPFTRNRVLTTPKESYRIDLKPENIEFIKKSMVEVNISGTSTAAFKGAGYVAGGKTGTAQVFSLNSKEYKHSSTAEFLRDHALYIAFAPADKPTIVIAMVVENAGFGAQHAAPIARRALDYYIEGKWPKEIPEWKRAP
ncbi:penicillin-binding protein 2 [Polynucleobacter hirudinilacicola]|uniref:Peptidoglycan D,D-transpeptidase MrdA n=1 Tax=Polynucleobacter hirudinilacicola TaxID=1743166 RepID=A0A210S0C0_9BURK|nr:penicillin-binding protein 2 [Polynucleobacter hirudinilacicola]